MGRSPPEMKPHPKGLGADTVLTQEPLGEGGSHCRPVVPVPPTDRHSLAQAQDPPACEVVALPRVVDRVLEF